MPQITFIHPPAHQHICQHCGEVYRCASACPTPNVHAKAHVKCMVEARKKEDMHGWKTLRKIGPVEIGLKDGKRVYARIGYEERQIHSILDWKAAVREILRERPRQNTRWPDGTLRGVKGFVAAETSDTPPELRALVPETVQRRLVTAVQRTALDDAALTAHRWDSSDMLRGVAGIHACWPGRGWLRGNSMNPSGSNHEICQSWLLTEVAGHGLCVTGEKGWRAQHITVVNLWLPKQERELGNYYMMKGVNVKWT